ncbi:MAG: hypothetical protein WAT74_05885 [Flavobacteriales bacterium]
MDALGWIPDFPGASGIIPRNKKSLSGSSAIFPSNNLLLSGASGIFPRNKKSMSGNSAILLRDKKVFPGASGIFLRDKTILLGNSAIFPRNKKSLTGASKILASNKRAIQGTSAQMQARMTNKKGTLELRWSLVYGAHGYQVWMTASDPSIEANWQAIGYTTRGSHQVTDLESKGLLVLCKRHRQRRRRPPVRPRHGPRRLSAALTWTTDLCEGPGDCRGFRVS